MPSFFNSFCHFQEIVERNNRTHEFYFCLIPPKLKKRKKIKWRFKFFWISHNPGGTLAIMNTDTQAQHSCSVHISGKRKQKFAPLVEFCYIKLIKSPWLADSRLLLCFIRSELQHLKNILYTAIFTIYPSTEKL